MNAPVINNYDYTTNNTNLSGPANNYSLQVSSGLIGKAVNLYSVFTTDYAGNTRPVSSVWDIGAYEYGAGTGSPAVVYLSGDGGGGSNGNINASLPASVSLTGFGSSGGYGFLGSLGLNAGQNATYVNIIMN